MVELSATSAAQGKVVQLNPANFGLIAYHPLYDVFVKFYAPWCGHCKAMQPAFESLAQEVVEARHAFYPATKVLVAEIDCQAHKDLCKSHGVDVSY